MNATNGWVRVAILLVGLLWFGKVASAEDLYPAAGASSPAGHGWIVIPGVRLSRDDTDPWQLYHVPPRTGPMASDDGIVRPAQAARLVARPDRIAAHDGTVWIVMGNTGGTPSPGRAVLTLSAVQHELADLWRDEPEEYPAACPSLVGEGTLVGLSAGPWGVGALLDDRANGRGLTLRVLTGQAWIPVEIPAIPEGHSVSLAAGRFGPTVVSVLSGVSVHVWRCDAPAEGTGRAGVSVDWSKPPVWNSDVLPIASGSAGLDHAARAAWRDTGSSITVAWARPGAKQVVLAELFPTGAIEFAAVSGEERPSVSFMGDRAAVFWHRPSQEAGTPHKLAVAEVSLLTGQAFYRGAAHAGLPITGSDVRLLLLVLTLLAASVFVFVIRGDSDRAEVVLPDGVLLAEPSTRIVATLLDLVLVMFIASRLTGISFGQLLSIKVAAGSEFIEFMLASSFVGAVQGFVLEAVFGRTVGKMFTGLVVARVVPGGIEATTAGASLVRNLVKWMLVPVGLLGLMEHNSRHRGDVWARTVVVSASGSPDNTESPD